MSISQKILDEISLKIEQGWTLIQKPCPICNLPLVQHHKKGTYCHNCGAFLISEEEAREKNLLREENPAEKEENSPEETMPGEEDWDESYFEERMKIVDQASSKIGARLLQGWTLLADSCEQCGTPMMSLKGGPRECVMCISKPKKTKPAKTATVQPELNKKVPAPAPEKPKQQTIEDLERILDAPKSQLIEKEAEPTISSFDKIIQDQKAEAQNSLKLQTERVSLSNQPQPQNVPQRSQSAMYMPPYQQVIQNNNSNVSTGCLVNTLTRKREDLHKLLNMSHDVQGVLTICNTITAINQAIETTNSTTTSSQMSLRTLNVEEKNNPVVQPGDKVPDVKLWFWNGDKKEQISLAQYCQGLTILFAVPGAFTPTCTKKHVPGFVNAAKNFYSQGVARIACIAVNDPFVMKAFGESENAHKVGIDMLADPQGELAKALGLCKKQGPPLGDRFFRSAFVVMNGVFYCVQVDEKGIDKTSAENMMKILLQQGVRV